MKIGIFMSSFPQMGGVYTYSLAMLNALQLNKDNGEIEQIVIFSHLDYWEEITKTRGLEFCLLTPECFAGILKFKKMDKLPYILLKAIQLRNRMAKPLSKTVKNLNVDLCVFTDANAESVAYDFPSITPIHDMMHKYEAEFPEVQYKIKDRDFYYYNMAVYAEGVLVDSLVGKKHVEETYLKGKSSDRIHVLPFIPSKELIDASEIMTEEDKKLIEKLPKRYFFYPAQYWQHKNHINIVKAIEILKDRIPDICIVFCGSKGNFLQEDCFEKTDKYIKNKDLDKHIIYLDFVSLSVTKQLYSKAEALIMASLFGPTNIPQIEAFALGCPVAVSNIYASQEQLGDAAMYFNPEDPAEIALCMDQLWNDESLRNNLIQKGIQHNKNWGEEQFANRLMEIIKLTVK